jgi:hypothetical protein
MSDKYREWYTKDLVPRDIKEQVEMGSIPASAGLEHIWRVVLNELEENGVSITNDQ